MGLPDEFVQQMLDELERLSFDYAAARANSRAAEENRKIVKSQLKRAFSGSNTAAEDYAHVHPKYKAAVKEMCDAGEKEDSAKWQLEIQKMKFEAWRTLSANERIARL